LLRRLVSKHQHGRTSYENKKRFHRRVGFLDGGAVLGNAATYLIGISGLAGWLLGFLPQDQSYVRLFFGVVEEIGEKRFFDTIRQRDDQLGVGFLPDWDDQPRAGEAELVFHPSERSNHAKHSMKRFASLVVYHWLAYRQVRLR
jgi:hypothetical protein